MRHPNDPFIDAIAERIRMILSRHSASDAPCLAERLGVAPDDLHRLIQARSCPIEIPFLIDVVTAMARELAVDPQWLLTGKYDGAVHRRALLLGENRTAGGARELREFIHKQYVDGRSPTRELGWLRIFGARS